MLINQIIDWNTLTEPQKSEALMRPAVQMGDKIASVVREVVENVRERKDDALREYSAKFDRCEVKDFLVTKDEFDAAEDALDASLKAAMVTAVANIEAFHKAQKLAPVSVQTMAGITCEQVTRPIESVGLYIPGGTAPLFSTALMLLVPAKIAGCKTIELCSPPPIAPEILYACRLCGVERVYKAGGAQAIAAMAFGTQSIGKVDKIFGPGNAYVTEAKRQVSQVADGAAIDMPAGPSEVLVIADAGANPAFVAADLLSQAEHGKDSQVVLVTDSEDLARAVQAETDRQWALLSRREIAEVSLSASRIIVAKDIAQCVEIANRYAPEHLIIETRNPRELVPAIQHAGSVFLGDFSPESAGDYASGTNHVLPTYGYAKTYSSLGLADFTRRMTVQELKPEGVLAIGPAVEKLAAAERLDAHKNAMTLRLAALKGK